MYAKRTKLGPSVGRKAIDPKSGPWAGLMLSDNLRTTGTNRKDGWVAYWYGRRVHVARVKALPDRRLAP